MHSTRFVGAAVAAMFGFGVGGQNAISQKSGGGPPKDKGAAQPGKPKSYDEVITKDAKTMPGFFAVHQVGDKVYFEIPQSALGRLMLWRAEVAKGPSGV